MHTSRVRWIYLDLCYAIACVESAALNLPRLKDGGYLAPHPGGVPTEKINGQDFQSIRYLLYQAPRNKDSPIAQLYACSSFDHTTSAIH